PPFTLLSQGTASIQQKGVFDWIMNWDYFVIGTNAKNQSVNFANHLDKKTAMLNVSEQNVEIWNLQPVNNPDELALLRCAYQRALGVVDCNCDERLCIYFKHHPERFHATDPGWLNVGKQCDVPRDACCVGRCGKTVVWVDAADRGRLADFTIA